MILSPPAQDKKPLKLMSFEFFIALLTILLVSASLDGILFAGGSKGGELNPIRQILLLPLQLYFISYCLQRSGILFAAIRRGWLFVFMILLAFLSITWSIDPAATFRRSAEFLLGMSFAFYLAVRYTPEEFCFLMARCLLVICFITIFAVVFDRSVGIHGDIAHYPAFRGYFPHKNSLGPIMVVGVLSGRVLMESERGRRLGWLVFGLSLALGILSLSRTAWLNIIMVLVGFKCVTFMRKRPAIGAFLFGIATVITLGLMLAFGFTTVLSGVTGLVGRSADLTDRTDFWPILIDLVLENRFLLGFGYDAFWTAPDGARTVNWNMENFIPPHAHNGWLECLTSFGVTGLVVLNLAILSNFLRTMKYALAGNDGFSLFGIVYLIFFMAQNITEPLIMSHSHILLVIFVYWSSVSLNSGPKPDEKAETTKPKYNVHSPRAR